MKTVGILLLFGLCTAIGLHAAAKKTANIDRIRGARRALSAFSEAIAGGGYSLQTIAADGEGLFFERLRVYIAAQAEGKSEEEAAALACGPFLPDELHAAALLFFGGLSLCSRAELRQRIERLSGALAEAEQNASGDVKQAKLIRAVGVLCGAALAVLLI